MVFPHAEFYDFKKHVASMTLNFISRFSYRLVCSFLMFGFSSYASANISKVSSAVDGLHIVAINKLPVAPQEASTDEPVLNCDRAPPVSPEGIAVSSLGWKVINEITSGDLTIIGFFSKGEDGTSGSCFVKNGNVAIYNKGVLQALIYGDEITDDSNSLLGAVSKTNLNNTFRLREFFPGMPAVADLFYDGNVARVQPIAPVEPFCNGIAPVPNIYGKDIKSVRKLLKNYEWKPENIEADQGDYIAKKLNTEGIVEVDSCSGTGFGFCSFNYQREGGISLNVITMGDDYTVTDYSANCPKQ
ncbi:hypothetical protein L6R44_11210 [Enterobacter cloacae complex sp. ECC445]|uniref:hypothetical protein n=1 Tax=Enterobacter cloacae complex sp. ECC445 TaxID=2913213 RepID=UPI001F2DDE8A|nr:hypothetical protein [Enterobacter cloacae complex sp. ECC445]MCG0456675.1 hypothetical protein [Enterobacter cloacae complex sp. ECC445]